MSVHQVNLPNGESKDSIQRRIKQLQERRAAILAEKEDLFEKVTDLRIEVITDIDVMRDIAVLNDRVEVLITDQEAIEKEIVQASLGPLEYAFVEAFNSIVTEYGEDYQRALGVALKSVHIEAPDTVRLNGLVPSIESNRQLLKEVTLEALGRKIKPVRPTRTKNVSSSSGIKDSTPQERGVPWPRRMLTDGVETLSGRDFVMKYANDKQRTSWSKNNWQYRNWKGWIIQVNEFRFQRGLSIFHEVET